MKLCVIGAGGKTGQRIVRLALERGHQVTAVLRDPTKLELSHGLLRVRNAPLLEQDALAEILKGHDAVVNAAGYVTNGPAYLALLDSVIGATEMALGSGGRFWLFGGAALLDVPGTEITTLDLPGVPTVFEAHRRNFQRVRRTALDWSMLCPGPMIDAPDGRPTIDLSISQDVWPVPRPGYTHLLPRIALSLAFKSAMPRMTIYYEDAAKVILDHLKKNGPLSRKRAGIALRGELRHKSALSIPAGRDQRNGSGNAGRAPLTANRL